MVNLLPPEVKQGYRYARRNVRLRRWIIMFLIALVGLGVIGTYGLLTIQQSTRNTQNHIDATERHFEDENYEATRTEVENISSSLKLVVKVLGQEVLFSKLIQQIAATIPDNAALSSLNINQTQGGIDISAMATNYDAATQVQVNLADPSNQIFSKADIVSINCGGQTLTNPRYPCTVNIRALFSQNNPFLFINSKGVQ